MVAFTTALKNKKQHNKRLLHIVVSQDHHPAGHISFASTHTGTNEEIKKRYQDLKIKRVVQLDQKENETPIIYYDNGTHNSSPGLFGFVRIYFEDNNYIDQMLWPDHGISGINGYTGDELLPEYETQIQEMQPKIHTGRFIRSSSEKIIEALKLGKLPLAIPQSVSNSSTDEQQKKFAESFKNILIMSKTLY